MNKRNKGRLSVKRSFEPDRLASMNLKEAYERLVPASIRVVAIGLRRQQLMKGIREQQEER